MRAIRRRISPTMTARTTYTTDSVPYPIGMSLAPVTAASTGITS
jgi:hypothetical protein